eukprot:COSAG01_NODE_5647_length_4118_cov_6.676288_2_plen_83_part_00
MSAPSLQQLQAAWAGGWTEGSWRTVVAGPTCQQGQNRLPCPMVCGHVQRGVPLQSKRLLIEARWVSKPLTLAGKRQPRRLNT